MRGNDAIRKLGETHIWRGALVVWVLLAAVARPAHAEAPPAAVERVYATADQVLRQSFPTASAFTRETRTLTAGQRQQIAKRIGFRLRDSVVTTVIARGAGGAVLGYGVQADEKGKYYPITFFVTADPEIRVRQVSVLVYRESRGDAVRRAQFLAQFRGKSPKDAIAADRDIVHVSGATMSSWAMAAGVRRVVATLATLYGDEARASR